MNSRDADIRALNGGSSSIRFAWYRKGTTLQRRLAGKIDRTGSSGARFSVDDPSGEPYFPHIGRSNYSELPGTSRFGLNP